MFIDGVIGVSEDRSEFLDRIIERLLIALLVFMPLAFGVVEAWSEMVVIALAGMMAVCFLLKPIVSGSSGTTWTWAYVPVIAFIGVILVQLIPFPTALVEVISPNTASRKAELLGDLPHAGEVLSHMTFSFYPHATRHGLRIVLAVAAVFAVVLNVYRRPEQIVRLLAVIAAVGAGIAVLALAQNLMGNNRIYWLVESPHGVATSGPFVNHSHYAQFMNLSIGAALGAFLFRLQQGFARWKVTPEAVAEYLGSVEAKPLWALLAMMVAGAGTVFLAMSRGGVISMLLAGALTTLALSLRKSIRGSGWIMVVLALGAFSCVLYIGFDAVYDRLTTLRDLSRAEGGRGQILRDIAVAWTRFPILGTGLDTHEVVYPEFDRSVAPALASHAENEYAQAAEETGILGLVALVTFAAIIGTYYVRAIQNDAVPICSAAYGLGFGLIAILVHSLSDFGQHLPANAILTAIFCALLIRLSHMAIGRIDERREAVSGGARWRPFWMGGLAVVLAVWAWGLVGANDARAAEAHWRKALAAERGLMDRGWQGADEEYAYLLVQASKAADRQPDNVAYRHWLNVYRWHSLSRTTDPNTGEFVLPMEAVEFAERIVDELNRARESCPTFGATWCVLGQLERSVLGGVEEGARHIKEGVKLAPCDATSRFVAGVLALEEDDTEVAVAHLERAVALDRRLFREVAMVLTDQFDRPDLALQIAGDDFGRLNVIVEILEALGENTESVEDVRRKVTSLLEQKCRESVPPAWALGGLAGIYARDGRVREAIDCYEQALALDYDRVEWRFNRARLLADVGDVAEAIREAKTCLHLRPEHAGAGRLIDRLLSDPRVLGQSITAP
ncbi:MAG: O-antigen ligase family protein [Sedimentisphaerales bacterium]|jgi:tetratricopeptide (TPR) repeat protein|nr:O-antigen ligase family protein [Sedimentisphaerales bacterium]HNY76784.1 O-antigen ligase family protein [Sedimentisphaerales bacterium]HOC61609.1 O-antigen ligase family protein [Sedimentisphaerales bacterium]HOH62441.1 O-antigen ligase family protein [Sedimentisphaerales bacterium]HPY52030.1 O-antigen ligase family protein [Sedimentisphaerales bacterium]